MKKKHRAWMIVWKINDKKWRIKKGDIQSLHINRPIIQDEDKDELEVKEIEFIIK